MKGLLFAISAYTTWGFFPLYFHYLSNVLPEEVLAHRIIWSFASTVALAIILKRFSKIVEAITNKTVLKWLLLSALLIALNWFVYIWAVTHQRVVESSLGYFITPIVSLILARVIFKERLHRLQIAAGLTAVVAIVWEVAMLGQLPWISIVLAVAFALYGVVRKLCPVDGLSGLTIETLLLLPITILWLTWQYSVSDSLAFGHDMNLTLLLIGSGALTALPLVLFAIATRLTDLSVVGFIMYINPIMQLIIGIFILDEAFPPERIVTFGLIWIALSLFLMGMRYNIQQTKSQIE